MGVHVPYTIIRDRTFFYNRRVGDSSIRISLKTKEDREALKRVSGIDEVVMNMVRQNVRIELIRQAARTWLKSSFNHR
jgi:hypothetical protein